MTSQLRGHRADIEPVAHAVLSSDSMVDLASLVGEGIRRIRRDEYERMVEIGLFDEDEKIELLDGVLVEMSPQGVPHAHAIRRLTEWLILGLRGRGVVGPQVPFALDDYSEPEPDITVVPPGDYTRAHPDRALLVIEVASSSLGKDRRIKGRLYAAAGVPDYWVVNLVDRTVEIHRDPAANGFRSVTTLTCGEMVSPLHFPDLRLAVDQTVPLAADPLPAG
jgi:Uma2 family endonuclease